MRWPRALPAAALFLFGAGVGAAGALASSSPSEACREAIYYAYELNDVSAAFAGNMADFLGATAAGDQTLVDAAVTGLTPIQVATEDALAGFLRSAEDC